MRPCTWGPPTPAPSRCRSRRCGMPRLRKIVNTHTSGFVSAVNRCRQRHTRGWISCMRSSAAAGLRSKPLGREQPPAQGDEIAPERVGLSLDLKLGRAIEMRQDGLERPVRTVGEPVRVEEGRTQAEVLPDAHRRHDIVRGGRHRPAVDPAQAPKGSTRSPG